MKSLDKKHFEKVEDKIRQQGSKKIHRVSGSSVKKIAKIIISKKK